MPLQSSLCALQGRACVQTHFCNELLSQRGGCEDSFPIVGTCGCEHHIQHLCTFIRRRIRRNVFRPCVREIEKEPFLFRKSSHGRGRRTRTLNKGFGDPRVTITPCPFAVQRTSIIISMYHRNVNTFFQKSLYFFKRIFPRISAPFCRPSPTPLAERRVNFFP